MIQDNFPEAGPAALWLEKAAREYVDSFSSIQDRDEERLVARFARAEEVLSRGDCVHWGWWLTGERFFTLSMISCSPNQYEPDAACPQQR